MASDVTDSISFASASDFARLTAKIDAMRALGIDRFALFLDDTAPELVHLADQARFATPVAAHADLANRLDDYVTGGDANKPHIMFVGYAYTSQLNGWMDYAQALGATLHPGIAVLWTGPQTYSRTMQASDMAKPNQLLGRKVVIWDNEPEGIGPLTGHSGDLPAGVSGYLANPVLIQFGYGFDDWWRTLGSVADYAWDPASYDPSSSFATWRGVGVKPSGC
jgi:hypothetical protein